MEQRTTQRIAKAVADIQSSCLAIDRLTESESMIRETTANDAAYALELLARLARDIRGDLKRDVEEGFSL